MDPATYLHCACAVQHASNWSKSSHYWFALLIASRRHASQTFLVYRFHRMVVKDSPKYILKSMITWLQYYSRIVLKGCGGWFRRCAHSSNASMHINSMRFHHPKVVLWKWGSLMQPFAMLQRSEFAHAWNISYPPDIRTRRSESNAYKLPQIAPSHPVRFDFKYSADLSIWITLWRLVALFWLKFDSDKRNKSDVNVWMLQIWCLLAVTASIKADGGLGLGGLVYAPGHASADYYVSFLKKLFVWL